MIRQLLPTALALVAGIALGRWVLGPPDAALDSVSNGTAGMPGSAAGSGAAGWSGDPRPGAGAAQTAAVQAALDEERARSRRLEQRLAALETSVETLDARLAAALEEASTPASAEASEGSAMLAALEDELGEDTPEDPEQRALQRFIDAGFSPSRARELKARQDQASLDRLFLRDRARREGWMGSKRYREEMQRINQSAEELRAELGDEDYDRYLYAIGRPNRVMIRETLMGGPAAQAGLKPGDAVISYNGKRIFSSRSLTRETQQGSFGAATAIEIERDGERMVLYIPRGPLGVNMRVSVRKPAG